MEPPRSSDGAADAQLAHLADPAFAWLWERARRVLERTGGAVEGSVSRRDPSDAERRAISGLLGYRRPARTLRVSLADVDRALRDGPLGMGLAAWLERTGPPLADRPAERARELEAMGALRDALARSHLAGEEWFERWLDELARDGLLRGLVRRGRGELVVEAARILEQLPADTLPLAMLGARASGDAKTLLAGALPGLVLRALATRAGVARPARAAERRALWLRFGVVPDDLSSQVLVLGLRLGAPGRASDAPLARMLDVAADTGLAVRVTLAQLASGLRGDIVAPPVVHVCENPQIVSFAQHRLGAACRPLLCTEGEPSLAGRRLVERLRAAGSELRYHGDFDWPGLAMTASFLERHDAAPWRMSSDDYRAALAALDDADADAAEPLVGRPVATPWDPALAAALAAAGRAVHEEAVADTLLADLTP